MWKIGEMLFLELKNDWFLAYLSKGMRFQNSLINFQFSIKNSLRNRLMPVGSPGKAVKRLTPRNADHERELDPKSVSC